MFYLKNTRWKVCHNRDADMICVVIVSLAFAGNNDLHFLLSLLRIILLFISFTYLILTLSYNIYILLAEYMREYYSSYDEYIAFNRLWYTCTTLLLYVNNSVNFILYCLGGRTYREEFLKMVGCFHQHDHSMQMNHSQSKSTIP